LLEPFLPDAAARIATALGAPLPAVYADIAPDWSSLGSNARIQRGNVLFSRRALDPAGNDEGAALFG
jgi:hypothetical protein